MQSKARTTLVSLFVSIALVVGLCPSLAFAATSSGSPQTVAAAATSLTVADDASQDEGGEGGESGEGDQSQSANPTDPANPADPSEPEVISITSAAIQLAQMTYEYDGAAKEPAVEGLTVGGTAVPLAGYTVAYSDNVNAGTATVTVTGQNGYEGTASTTFKISPANASALAVATIPAQTYTGSSIAPAPAVTFKGKSLKAGVDYTVGYSANTAAGTATATVTGKGNFTGSKTVTFKIEKAALQQKHIAPIADKTYSGAAFTPSPKVTFNGKTLKPGTDYAVKYANNKNAGTATATVTGKGNFTGTQAVSFKIRKAALLKKHVSPLAGKTYSGAPLTPTPVVKFNGKKLKAGVDFAVSYASNANAGKATATVKGKGNFAGKQAVSFKIARADIAKAAVGKIPNMTYTGAALTPKVSLAFNGKKLKLGRDYTVAYSSNTNAGWATVVIAGKGNFTGRQTASFAIVKAPISRAVSVKIPSRTYTGAAITPNPVLRYNGYTLKFGRDYTLRYASNTSAGQAKVYVYGTGNFTGGRAFSFTILPASILRTTVASIGESDYTGGAIEPSPAVTFYGKTLVRNRDYTLAYSNNVGSGTASVSVKGIGNFYGTKTVHFRINAPAPEPEPEPEADDSDDGDTVYITNTGTKYHRDGCSSLRSSRVPISRSDAIARGYEPCKNCRP